jgi:RloB-like protein
MSGSRHFRSLRRHVGTRTPKPKIVIYAEGKNTERDYFEAMQRTFRSVVVDIEIIEGAGVPLTIAKKVTAAARLARRRHGRQSYEQNDEFWAVFDRDEHPNVPDAIARCHEANVGVAFSNPCFEIWLILHFQDYDRPDHRRDVQRHLATLCCDYDHARRKTTDCSALMALVTAAEQRAEIQLQRRKEEGDPPRPPFTTVYELTRRIRADSE